MAAKRKACKKTKTKGLLFIKGDHCLDESEFPNYNVKNMVYSISCRSSYILSRHGDAAVNKFIGMLSVYFHLLGPINNTSDLIRLKYERLRGKRFTVLLLFNQLVLVYILLT